MSKEYIYKYRTIRDNSLNTLVRNQIFVTTPWVVEFMKSYCISSKIGLYQMRIQNGALINDLAKDKIVNMDGTLSK